MVSKYIFILCFILLFETLCYGLIIICFQNNFKIYNIFIFNKINILRKIYVYFYQNKYTEIYYFENQNTKLALFY